MQISKVEAALLVSAMGWELDDIIDVDGWSYGVVVSSSGESLLYKIGMDFQV